MTNAIPILTIAILTTILITGSFISAPFAYSTGSWNNNDDDDDHDDGDKHKDKEDCECKKPTVFTVIYKGPGVEGAEDGPHAEVTIEIYKSAKDIGNKPPLLTINGIFNGEPVTIDSNVYGKKKIESNTVYRVIQNGVQIAVIPIHTSCSQPLNVGDVHSDGQVTLTVDSGFDFKGRKAIFLEHDPICEGATLRIKKVVVPEDDTGKFILQIDGNNVDGSEIGNGGTAGPVLLPAGSHTVGEIAGTGTNLADYRVSFGGDCDEDGKVNLKKGKQAECIIKNVKKLPATITLKKALTNDNGGLATPNDFQVTIIDVGPDGKPGGSDDIQRAQANFPSTGAKEFMVPAGTYSLKEAITDSEIAPNSYTTVLIAGDTACPSMEDEAFTLNEGDHIACTIYNDDNFVPVQPGGQGIIFRNHSMKVQLNESEMFDSCDRYTDPADKDPCIEIISASNGIIGIVDSALTSDTTIVLFSVIEANRLETTTGAQNPVCSISAITQHDKQSFFLKDPSDETFPTNPTSNNVVVLKCIGMILNGEDPDITGSSGYNPTYNVNYVMIDPTL